MAVAEESYALQQVSRRDAAGREDNILARRQVGSPINLLRILDAHFFHPPLHRFVTNHQPPQHLAVEAAHGGGRDYAFRRPADSHHRVNARAPYSSGNPGRQVAIADQPDARAGFANGSDQTLMTRTIQHHHDEIIDIAIQPLGDRFEIIRRRSIQVERALASRPGDDLLHVAIRGMQQSAGFRGSQHGDGVGRAGGAQIRALQRIYGDVDRRVLHAGRRCRAHAFADVQHGRLIALALADHDVSSDVYVFESTPHGLHRGMIGAGVVALSHGARRRDGGFLHHPSHLKR